MRREQRFEMIARRGADEIARHPRDARADRRGVGALGSGTRQKHDAGIDIVRAHTGLVEEAIDDPRQRLFVDRAVLMERRQHDRRQEERRPRDRPVGRQPRERRLRAGRSDVEPEADQRLGSPVVRERVIMVVIVIMIMVMVMIVMPVPEQRAERMILQAVTIAAAHAVSTLPRI